MQKRRSATVCCSRCSQTDTLALDPQEAYFILPTAEEAFDFAYEQGTDEVDWDVYEDEEGRLTGNPMGVYKRAKWLTVSLDLFGISVP